ncbi:MAG: CbiX/SirB N-terminal domain-containing protein [Candidatus Solibacter sp.]
MTTGIIVFAHGSRIEAANQAVRSAAGDLARSGGFPLVEAAFLELGRPSLEEAAAQLVERGIDRLVILPYFLTPGMHLERDLPVLVNNITSKFSDLDVVVTPSLDGHPGLVDVLADRLRSALL